MRRLLLACIALLLFGAGCDNVGQPTWAARIDGDEISMSDVEALLRLIEQPTADPAAGATTTTVAVQLTGSTTREALAILIRWDLIERRLDQLGETVTDEARTQAEQQVGEDFEAPKATRQRILDGIAAESTLTAVLVQRADDPELSEVVDQFYDANEGTWDDWVCLEGLAVPATDRAAVDAAFAVPGATVEGVAAAGLPSVQPLFATGVAGCFPGTQLPEDLTTLLDSTPDGDLAVLEQQDEQVGAIELYLRETGRKDIARDDPNVLSAFASALQGQGGQQWLNLVISSTARSADIEILSTIGSGYDDRTLTVTAPATPLGVTTTTSPLIPQSG